MVRKSLEDRYTDVYYPSADDKKRWKQMAKERGYTLSKFLYEMAERSLEAEEKAPRTDMIKELSESKDRIRKLENELRLKALLIEKLETDLYKLRYDEFNDLEREGSRHLDKELINIMKKGRTLPGFEILRELNIDPRDSEAARLVSNQLESLRRFGLINETPNGWRWIS
jgi:hypothetical protein